ncbi:unnamed protein product, partial [Adineta ricciae]
MDPMIGNEDNWNEFKKHLILKEKILNENEEILGYDFLYEYENHFVLLNYNLLIGKWKIVSSLSNEKINLEKILNEISSEENLQLKQQIAILIEKFNEYFSHLKYEEELLDLPSESITNHFQEKLDNLTPTRNHHRIRQD